MKLVRRSEFPASASVRLPASKSLSLRHALAYRLAGGNPEELEGLSESDDVRQFVQALMADHETSIHIGEGAAPLRFFLAYRAAKNLPCSITGSPRLMQRPHQPLLDALQDCGAGIISTDDTILLTRGMQRFGRVTAELSNSSQYASALMLVAPLFHGSKTIVSTGRIVSMPYLKMTAGVMAGYGIGVAFTDREIHIETGSYEFRGPINIEADWSAAAFFYALATCMPGQEIALRGLQSESLQGDCILVQYFEKIGVSTSFSGSSASITSVPVHDVTPVFNLEHHPDLGPALMAACAFSGINAVFHGADNLTFKESDRLQAMAENLGRFGVKLQKNLTEQYRLDTSALHFPEQVRIDSYGDHRIAMAMAVFALKSQLSYTDPGCVSKSFPGFWNEWAHWFNIQD